MLKKLVKCFGFWVIATYCVSFAVFFGAERTPLWISIATAFVILPAYFVYSVISLCEAIKVIAKALEEDYTNGR